MFSSKVFSVIATGLAFVAWGSFELLWLQGFGFSTIGSTGWAMAGIGVAIVTVSVLIGARARSSGGAVVSPGEFIGRIVAAAPWVAGTWLILTGIRVFWEVRSQAPSTRDPRLSAALEDPPSGMLLLPQLFVGCGLLLIIGNLIWNYKQSHSQNWGIPNRRDDFF